MELKRPRGLAPIAATAMALLGLFASFFVVAGRFHSTHVIVVPTITVEVALIALAIYQWSVFLTRYIAFEIERRIHVYGSKMEARSEEGQTARATSGDASSPARPDR